MYILRLGVIISGLIIVMPSLAYSGNLEPSNGTTNPMFTIEDIFNRLGSSTVVTKRPVSTFTLDSAFAEPSNGPVSTGHTLDDVMDLVNSRARVPKTGQTSTKNPNDDGALQKGITIPNPRFTDNGDGTVTDNLTTLIWLKNANCIRTWTISSPLRCNSIGDGLCGLTDGSVGADSFDGDWRVPNVNELHSLINYNFSEPALSNTAGTGKWQEGDPFDNVQPFYWTSSAGGLVVFLGDPILDVGWTVNLDWGWIVPWFGSVFSPDPVMFPTDTIDLPHWCVRGGQNPEDG